MRDEASARVWLLARLRVDCRGDLPEHDPDHRHRLAGDEVLLVQRGTLGVPLSQQLVLAGLGPEKLAEALGGAPDRAP
jgi:molybdopterin/thiamine biosynthesis adenylyltransferase